MREFGFIIPERPVVVDNVRVRGTGRSGLHLEDTPKTQIGPPRVDKVGGPACARPPWPTHRDTGSSEGAGPRNLTHPTPPQVTQCYFEGGYQETPVYLLGELGYGHKFQGPCLIIDSNRWACGLARVGPRGCSLGHSCRGLGGPWGPGMGFSGPTLQESEGLWALGSLHGWSVLQLGDVGSLAGKGMWPGHSSAYALLPPAPSWWSQAARQR